jgi:hypothetical protein
MNILLLIIGLALLVGGIVILTKNLKLSKKGISMAAEIVEVIKKRETSTDSEGYTSTRDMYYPIYKYEYKDVEYQNQSNVGVSNKRKYKVGDTLNIVFLEESPEKSKVKNFLSMWLTPGILIIAGVIIVIASFTV